MGRYILNTTLLTATIILLISCSKDEKSEACLDQFTGNNWQFEYNGLNKSGDITIVNDSTLNINLDAFNEELNTTCQTGELYKRWSIGNHGFGEIKGTITNNSLFISRYIDPFAGIGITIDTIIGSR